MNGKLRQFVIGITAAAALACAGATRATGITGAGATFPYPISAKCGADAKKRPPHKRRGISARPTCRSSRKSSTRTA